MTFGPIDSLNNTGYMLDLIAKRQKVIGDNLANMDTPGYVRKDLDFSQYLGSMDNSLETKLASKFGSPIPVEESTSAGPINPANELLELQKNSILYTMATRRMSSVINEMKTVINVGK